MEAILIERRKFILTKGERKNLIHRMKTLNLVYFEAEEAIKYSIYICNLIS